MNVRAMVGVGLALGLCVGATALDRADPAASGAMFRGGPTHPGVYDDPGVPALHGAKWTFHTNGPIYASPAVADGVAYIGSADGSVYAVDVATGTQKWKLATKGRVVSSPAVAQGVVYLESYDGNLYAIDASTGHVKWTFATLGERRFAAPHIHGLAPDAESMPDLFDFFLSSPTVAGEAVYFGSGDGNVYAVNTATGALRWKVPTGNVVHGSPAVSGGVVFIGGWDTFLHALDAQTGQERWRFKTGDDDKIHNQTGLQSSPTVVDGVVYVGCRDSHLYAVDARTGKARWAYDTKGSWVIASPAVDQGTVYFTTSDSALFEALDAKTGTLRFSVPFKWPMFSSPAIAGTMAYVGAHDGRLLAVDLTARRLAWAFETDGARTHGPTFTKPDGSPNYGVAMHSMFYDDIVAGVAQMFTAGAILSSPTIVGDTIYVGSADGSLYAIH